MSPPCDSSRAIIASSTCIAGTPAAPSTCARPLPAAGISAPTGTITVALDQWSSFTIHAIAAGQTSTIEIRADGARLFVASSANLFTTEFDTLRVGGEHVAQEDALLADDIVIKRLP